MVAERKMQPLPPPEHRRAFRFVAFLAVSLLAFSCWALVSSRINDAVPDSAAMVGDVDKMPAFAGEEGARRPTPAASAAVPASGGAVKLMSDPVIQEPLVRGGGGGGGGGGKGS